MAPSGSVIRYLITIVTAWFGLCGFVMPLKAEVLPYRVITSAAETRVEIPYGPDKPIYRTSFERNPRRFIIDIAGSALKPAEAGPSVLPSPTDPRVEKVARAWDNGRTRYTVFIREGVPVVYRIEENGPTLLIVLKSSKPALPELGSAPLPSKASLQLESPHGAELKASAASAETAPPSPVSLAARAAEAPGTPPAGAGASYNDPPAKGDTSQLFQNARLRGFMEATGAADTARENRYEHTRAFRNRLRLEGKFPLSESFSAAHLLVSGESDLLWFGPDMDATDDRLNLYEGYLHWARGPLELRLGKQIVRWGKTDQLSPLDNLNPQDLRQFIIPTLEERKIPNWMGRLRLFHDPFSLEAVAIPFFEPAEVDFFGTDWALYRHTREVLAHAPLPPSLHEAFSQVGVHRDDPPRTLGNTQWGLRTAATVSGWDLAASWLYAWNPMPFIERFPVIGIDSDGSFKPSEILAGVTQGTFIAGDVAVSARRSHILGVEWETVLGSLGFRGETALATDTVLLTSALTSVTSPSLFTVIGWDRTWDSDFYANVQIGHQVLFDHDADILYFRRHNVSVNGEVRKGFLRGDWEARLRALVMLTDGGSFWNPSLTYLGFRPLSLTFGFNLFAGPADTFLGTYGDNDQTYVTVKYDF